jgi:hypothetical protein
MEINVAIFYERRITFEVHCLPHMEGAWGSLI